MKQKEILLDTPSHNSIHKVPNKKHTSFWDNPVRPDAFDMNDGEKIEKIAQHFKAIMHILGLDLTDDSLQGTPRRVAKMYVQEAFKGLNPKNKPSLRLFDNKYQYDQILIEKNIAFHSHCEHHFVPIYGKVHVAYLPHDKIIGLSKIHRIVQYYAKRPQVQERLTVQIGKDISYTLDTNNVGVVVDANHMCITSRGVGDSESSTQTAYLSGIFSDEEKKQEFFHAIQNRNLPLSCNSTRE